MKTHNATKSASDEKDGSAYERFERFTKALIAVPKSEIDKRQAECEKAKKPRRRNHDYQDAG